MSDGPKSGSAHNTVKCTKKKIFKENFYERKKVITYIFFIFYLLIPLTVGLFVSTLQLQVGPL